VKSESVPTDKNFYETIYDGSQTAPWSGLDELDHRTSNWLSEYDSEVPDPRRVLDLGAGEGRITQLFAGKSYHAVGLDLLIEPLRVAQSSSAHGNASYVQGSAFEAPFESGQFAALVDYGLLHHVRKDDWSTYRDVLRYLLVPGALCFISVFHETDNHANRSTRKWVYHRGHYDRFFELEDLETCLGEEFKPLESGLVEDGEHTFLHTLFRYHPVK